jgi:hypothetical protein
MSYIAPQGTKFKPVHVHVQPAMAMAMEAPFSAPDLCVLYVHEPLNYLFTQKLITC